MTTVAALQGRFAEDAYLSSASQEAGRPLWRLLDLGSRIDLRSLAAEGGAVVVPRAVARRFYELAEAWRDQCAHLPSVREMVLHPAYQQIVGMGPSALPFIFAELEKRPEHWFWALRAITSEDPVPAGHRGNVAAMAEDWLGWARAKGIWW